MTFQVVWPKDPLARRGAEALIAVTRLVPASEATGEGLPALVCGNSPAPRAAPFVVRIPTGEQPDPRRGVQWNQDRNGSQQELVASADVIQWASRVLTLGEEVSSGIRDERGRFLARMSALTSDGLLDMPVVDRVANSIRDALRRALDAASLPAVEVRPWPGGAPAAVCLTHDVDQVQKYSLYRLKEEALHPRPQFVSRAIRALRARAWPGVHTRDPFWTFTNIRQLENRVGATSAFYFGTVPDRQGLEYRLERSAELQTVVGDLARQGCEIGLHAHCGTSTDLGALRADKERLDRFTPVPSEGVRQHDLRLHPPESWRHQANAGFSYDSTVGFPDSCGFRAGTSFPYRPLPGHDDFWEIPMHLMDTTLKAYEKLEPDLAWRRVSKLLDEVLAVGGMLVANWHNNTFDTEERDPYAEVYTRLLLEASHRSASFVLPREALSRWRACASLSFTGLQRVRDGWMFRLLAPYGAKEVKAEIRWAGSTNNVVIDTLPGHEVGLSATP